MIVRLIAIDPRPRGNGHSDILVYQVPENSREFELLTELFAVNSIEWETITIPRKSKATARSVELA